MGSLNAFLISQCYLASGFPKKKTSHYKKMKKHSKKKKSVKQPTVSLKPSLSSGPSLKPSLSSGPSLEPSETPSLKPSETPSLKPSDTPSLNPSQTPSLSSGPSLTPSQIPSKSRTVFYSLPHLKAAIEEYVSDEDRAVEIYGDIEDWDTGLLEDFSNAFNNGKSKVYFNGDISKWDVSRGKILWQCL